MDIMVGMKGIVEDMVETADTAAEVGSGSLLVYATPCMVAMMEGASCEAIDRALFHHLHCCVDEGLPDGFTPEQAEALLEQHDFNIRKTVDSVKAGR